MKLAEALILQADYQKRIEQLKQRFQGFQCLIINFYGARPSHIIIFVTLQRAGEKKTL